MSKAIDERLLRLLGGDDLSALRKRLRKRFELAVVDDGIERIHIAGLTESEHAALAWLTGRPQRHSNSLKIDVRMVDEALRSAGIAGSLREALEQLDGPVVHRATERLRLQALWSDVIERCTHPGLAGLFGTSPGVALLKRLSGWDAPTAAELCRRAELVLRRLPARGITRSQLAAEVLGDAHALDSGQAVATLVLAVWRPLAAAVPGENGDTAESSEDDDPQSNVGTERTRDIWARAGVMVNELARPALLLNLPTRSDGHHRSAWGEPAYASLRSLLRSPPAWDVKGRNVYVCENPNLLAIAADHWGAACAPMACTDGMPGAAQRCLLSQLAGQGARLCYHGDFDWGGLRIGNLVMREHGAQPWRFGAQDYAAAVRSAPGLAKPLEGRPVEATWDMALTVAMREQQVSVAEEALAASLLPDLDDG